ncbi:MAG: SH3 domain-containing protein [Desulfobulbaceae bacterium]|nr:SH3 domain-containing protein [Desulfobulbaceae bacterium]
MTKTMTVQVKQCQLRSKPTFLGKVVKKLDYGERVEIEKEENSWVNVSPGGKNAGWVHISALSEKEIILNPNSQDIKEAASNDEIALAGKGFNKQVEKKFRQDNKSIDFSWVDKMEKIVVSQNEIQNFISQGGIKAKGGA